MKYCSLKAQILPTLDQSGLYGRDRPLTDSLGPTRGGEAPHPRRGTAHRRQLRQTVSGLLRRQHGHDERADSLD